MGQRAINPQTGETIEWNGTQWVPVDKAAVSVPSQVMADQKKLDDPVMQYVMQGADGFFGLGNPALEMALQGATFGTSDEVGASLRSLGQLPFSDYSFSELYEANKQAIRQRMNQYQQENPMTSLGLMLAGGMATGGIGGKAILASRLGQARPLLAASIGSAGGGGLAGFGFSEADNASDLAYDALLGASIGGMLPPAMRSAMGAVRMIGRMIPGLYRAGKKLADPVKVAADNQVASAFARDRITLDEAARRGAELGPDTLVVDTGGQNVRQLLQNAASLPGKTAEIAETKLSRRVAGSTKRLIQDFSRATGIKGSALSETKKLMQERAKAAAPLYERINKELISISDDMRPSGSTGFDDTLRQLFERPEMKTAWRRAVVHAKSDLEWPSDVKIPSAKDLKPGSTVPFAALDWTKRELWRMEEAARRKDPGGARLIANLRRQLTDILDTNFPQYKAARDEWAGRSAVISAIEKGKRILRDDPEEMADMVADMGKSEWIGYATGALKAVSDKLKQSGVNTNAANRMASQIVRERIRNAFPDEDSYQSFIKALDRENLFSEVRNTVLRGSPTQKRLGAQGVISNEIMDSVADTHANAFVTALHAFRAWKNALTEPLNEKVRDRIGEILLSDVGKNGALTLKGIKELEKLRLGREKTTELIRTINATMSPPVTEVAVQTTVKNDEK